MLTNQNVSPNVSLGVSFSGPIWNAEIISAKKFETKPDGECTAKRPTRKPSAGLYLIKTGSAYLFQMRLPRRIAGDVKRPVRVGLGVIPKQEARAVADRLAAGARDLFEKIGKAMDEDDAEFWPFMESILGAPDGEAVTETDQRNSLRLVTMYLQSELSKIRNPLPPLTPEQQRQSAMWGGLIEIGRQAARKEAGEPYDADIADNAHELARQIVDHYDKGGEPSQAEKAPARPGPIQLVAHDPATLDETETDRRLIERPASDKPLFSQVASRYLQDRIKKKDGINKDHRTAQARLNLFVELIGDYPVDTYTPSDLQAFIDLMAYWPSREKDRPADKPALEIIKSNRDLSRKPLGRKTLQNGYMGVIKPVFSKGARLHDFPNTIEGARLEYSEISGESIPAEPLAVRKIAQLFKTGAQSDYIDDVMLPLIGYLTGRRLGLLIHLKGSDIREKFDGVWVAEAGGIIEINGRWGRRPIKNAESGRYFVLHNFLAEIGFIDWARAQGDTFLFPQLMGLADPSKSASQYMRRLFDKAGIKDGPGERFHSLRGDYISDTRGNSQVSERTRRLQVGHAVGSDDHDKYGWKTLTETEARQLADLSLREDIDLSMFRGLDFDRLAKARRSRGRRK